MLCVTKPQAKRRTDLAWTFIWKVVNIGRQGHIFSSNQRTEMPSQDLGACEGATGTCPHKCLLPGRAIIPLFNLKVQCGGGRLSPIGRLVPPASMSGRSGEAVSGPICPETAFTSHGLTVPPESFRSPASGHPAPHGLMSPWSLGATARAETGVPEREPEPMTPTDRAASKQRRSEQSRAGSAWTYVSPSLGPVPRAPLLAGVVPVWESVRYCPPAL